MSKTISLLASTGYTIEALPQGNTYPTGGISIPETTTQAGDLKVYENTSVSDSFDPNGAADIYINGLFKKSIFYHARDAILIPDDVTLETYGSLNQGLQVKDEGISEDQLDSSVELGGLTIRQGNTRYEIQDGTDSVVMGHVVNVSASMQPAVLETEDYIFEGHNFWDGTNNGVQVSRYEKTSGTISLFNYNLTTSAETHQAPSLMVADDGNIVVAFDDLVGGSGGHNGGIEVLRTTTPYDITTLTSLGTIIPYGAYPSITKFNSGRLMINCRNFDNASSPHPERGIAISDDDGATWGSPYKLADLGSSYWAYGSVSGGHNEDASRHGFNIIAYEVSSADYIRNFALFTEDGYTWTNFDKSFSKTFTDGDNASYFTYSELDTHCFVAGLISGVDRTQVTGWSFKDDYAYYFITRRNSSTLINSFSLLTFNKSSGTTESTEKDIIFPYDATDYDEVRPQTALYAVTQNHLIIVFSVSNSSDHSKDRVCVLETKDAGKSFSKIDFTLSNSIKDATDSISTIIPGKVVDGINNLLFLVEIREGTATGIAKQLFYTLTK